MKPARLTQINGETFKECSKCKEFKDMTAFNKSKNGLFGRQSKCIECVKTERLQKLGREHLLVNITFFKNGVPHKKCQQCREVLHVKKFLMPSGRKYATCKTCRYFNKAKAYKQDKKIFKHCDDCNTHQTLANFSLNGDRAGYFGRKNACKYCMRSRYKRYRDADKESARERTRVWRENNPEKQAEAKKKWRLSNLDKERAQGQRRRARLRKLDNSLTDQEWRLTCEIFDHKCALTGSEDISMDHFIPVSTGYGGTHSGNVYPLSKSLNFSKHNNNPFVWFENVKDRFDLDPEKFERVVGVLAALNGMRTLEYKEYVQSIFREVSDLDEKEN